MKLFVLTSKYFPKITTVSCKFHLHFFERDNVSRLPIENLIIFDGRRGRSALASKSAEVEFEAMSLPICLCPKVENPHFERLSLWHVLGI